MSEGEKVERLTLGVAMDSLGHDLRGALGGLTPSLPSDPVATPGGVDPVATKLRQQHVCWLCLSCAAEGSRLQHCARCNIAAYWYQVWDLEFRVLRLRV